MAILNFANREITAKVVYFGATGAGCNTNLRQLHQTLKDHSASQLHQFGPSDIDERSLYFDYLAAAEDVLGFRVRFQVYSLPGGLALQAHREELIRDTDAVVFVSDARPARSQQNMDSLLDLEQLLANEGVELAAAPVVIQVNRVDAEGAKTPDDVVFDLNPYGFPVVPAIASFGKGVLETHVEVATATAERIRDQLSGTPSFMRLTAVHRPDAPSDTDVIRDHIQNIRTRTEGEAPLDVEAISAASPDLAEGPHIEIPFQPRDFVGSRPVEVLAAQIDDDRIRLDVVMSHMGSAQRRRLTVLLANRPTDTPAVARPSPPVVEPAEDRVRNYLPDSVDLHPALESPDLPGMIYGVIGVAGGILIGALASYLFGMFA